MKRMWAPEELQALAVAAADAEILAKVNIEYDIINSIPTWKFGPFSIKDDTNYTIFGSSKTIEMSGIIRFTGLVRDENNNLGSVKKIYCHPISLSRTDASLNNYFLTLLIFNNSPTPFTLETLIAYIRSLPNATFVCNGNYRDAQAFALQNDPDNDNALILYKYDSATVVTTEAGRNFADCTTFKDGINAIN